jgi:predicted ATPase
VERAGSGRQAVLLLGDPGIGKSRLAHECAQGLKAEGWRLIDAECSPNLQGAPFSTLKRILQSVLDGPAIRSELADSLDVCKGLPAIQQCAVDAVLDRPISDPQWEELLVLLTSRPFGMPEWIARCRAEIVALRPLDDDSGMAMLTDMLGPSANNSDLKSRIISHTANVPLFIEEVCRGLKDSGMLRGQWGDLALARPVEELGIPTSIQGVIAARLDRVSRQERALLQFASALGPRSTEAVLREVAALPEDVLQDCLAALDRAELLVKVDSGLEGLLTFPHEMIRQVAYDSMVEKVRETAHARILAALESNGSWADEPNRLCYHATRAKDWKRAFSYGRAAARKSLAQSAFADAVNYFEIAMDALDKAPVTRAREMDAIDLRIEARRAFMWSGQVAESLDLGEEAERRATAIDDIGRKVAAMTVRAAAQNFYGTPVEAISIGEELVGLAEGWGDAGWLNLAQYGLGQAYHLAGRYREAAQMFERACAQLTGRTPALRSERRRETCCCFAA